MPSTGSQSTIIDKEEYYRFDHDEYKKSIETLKKLIKKNKPINMLNIFIKKNMQNETNESNQILEIAKYITHLEKCPANIKRESLLRELDCEDLRSRIYKNPKSVTDDELWRAYVDINAPIFGNEEFPHVETSKTENITQSTKNQSPKNKSKKNLSPLKNLSTLIE